MEVRVQFTALCPESSVARRVEMIGDIAWMLDSRTLIFWGVFQPQLHGIIEASLFFFASNWFVSAAHHVLCHFLFFMFVINHPQRTCSHKILADWPEFSLQAQVREKQWFTDNKQQLCSYWWCKWELPGGILSISAGWCAARCCRWCSITVKATIIFSITIQQLTASSYREVQDLPWHLASLQAWPCLQGPLWWQIKG